ncbi:MAG TPA: hypothetical protein VIY51_08145 [Xanthobacteraceae bacterium]
MDVMARSPGGVFTAKLTGPDGYMEGRFFSTEKAAREWLTGAGLRSFEGDVKRAELCSPDSRLIWAKSRPKIDDQLNETSRAACKAGLPGHGRPSRKASRS